LLQHPLTLPTVSILREVRHLSGPDSRPAGIPRTALTCR
jgi:hypothetical protein